MPNNYFQFKQFTIYQDLAAMKVGTDGVLLGAWANLNNATKILDVGTGTGLIALMLAQRNSIAQIDAIEIDKHAYKQALINFTKSPWNDRVNGILSDFQTYKNPTKYDLIVSNPPYFNNALKNDCSKKSTARHTDSLSYDELIHCAAQLLTDNGLFCVILPANERISFENMAKDNNLFLNKLLNVKPTPNKPFKRVLMEFSFINKKLIEETLIIEEFGRHQYSDAYKQLTKDFYLAF